MEPGQSVDEVGPSDFSELLLVPGLGPRTVRALAMVAEVLNGAPCRFSGPTRFSFAHGGKDRHPFPVPIRVYDQTIQALKSAVRKAKLGRKEELGVLRRLDSQSRRLERSACGPSVQTPIAQERRESHVYAGRSVFGWQQAEEIPAAEKLSHMLGSRTYDDRSGWRQSEAGARVSRPLAFDGCRSSA